MIHRLLTAIVAGLVAAPALAADLTIEVHGIRSGDGQLYVAVHTPETKDTFPAVTGKATGLDQPARIGTLRFVLRDLHPGQYAVNAFHDENGNGEFDTNLFGIPSEGYGFANDPDAMFGPPDFEAAAVNVGDTGGVAAMTLRY